MYTQNLKACTAVCTSDRAWIALSLENIGEVPGANVLMVGDREYDILGAKELGIDSVGVLFGYGDKEELENAGATYIIEKMTDILEIV